MADFTAHRHPVLAVRCPACGKATGLWCRRPNRHVASDLHEARQTEANRQFLEQHGDMAAIIRAAPGWLIDPRPHPSLRRAAMQT